MGRYRYLVAIPLASTCVVPRGVVDLLCGREFRELEEKLLSCRFSYFCRIPACHMPALSIFEAFGLFAQEICSRLCPSWFPASFRWDSSLFYSAPFPIFAVQSIGIHVHLGIELRTGD